MQKLCKKGSDEQLGSEKNFETQVKKWLHNQGIYAAGTAKDKMEISPVGWFFKVWGGGFQKSGIPDLLICVNGFFIACELKADNGKPSELQEKNIQMINQGNGIGIILYPKGFEEFKEIIKGVKNCNIQIQRLNALKLVHSSTKCVILME